MMQENLRFDYDNNKSLYQDDNLRFDQIHNENK